MLSLLLAAAAAAAPTAVDAERAFAADAQRIGQWTAFRKYADRDAVMFTPQAVWAHEFLKDRKDPPKAVAWRPTAELGFVRRPHRGQYRSGVPRRQGLSAISTPSGSAKRAIGAGSMTPDRR